jgi:hypothetical protein
MPISENSACTCSSVALNDRLPTYNFFTAVLLASLASISSPGTREGTPSEAEESGILPRAASEVLLPAEASAPATRKHLAASVRRSQPLG